MCHYPEEVAKRLREEVYPEAIAAGMWEGELTINRPDGTQCPVSQLIMAHRDDQGKVAYISTVARDISDRKRAEMAAQHAALREKNFANSVINNLPGIFYLVDERGQLMRWNSNLEQSLGYSGDELHNMNLQQLVAQDDIERMQQGCTDTLKDGAASLEVSLISRHGHAIPFFINGIRIEGADTGAAVVGIGIDIRYRLQLEQELRARATTDTLTGAYNRLRMEEALEHEIRKSTRYQTPFAIAMFDVDHFKQVNDTYGHDTGDRVLKQVVAITRQQLREVDLLARWGGEEFMIIASSTTLDEIHNLADRVRAAIAAQHIEGVGHITVSFGVGEYRQGERQKDLLKRVDDMLYQAKDAGRNRVHIAL
jgi:diguanylate cyclase (GGDEF)-like protein/PAS domain S-box-containing protein